VHLTILTLVKHNLTLGMGWPNPGHCHKFVIYFTWALKILLQEILPDGSPELNFSYMCLQLDNQLYNHSCSLNI